MSVRWWIVESMMRGVPDAFIVFGGDGFDERLWERFAKLLKKNPTDEKKETDRFSSSLIHASLSSPPPRPTRGFLSGGISDQRVPLKIASIRNPDFWDSSTETHAVCRSSNKKRLTKSSKATTEAIQAAVESPS